MLPTMGVSVEIKVKFGCVYINLIRNCWVMRSGEKYSRKNGKNWVGLKNDYLSSTLATHNNDKIGDTVSKGHHSILFEEAEHVSTT
jgi:hypothetical protein